MTFRLTKSLAGVLLLALATCGCSAINKHVPLPETFTKDVAKERRERKKNIIVDFERKRSGAQTQAAARLIEQGETAEARRLLLGVLERDPSFADAQELLGQLGNPTNRTSRELAAIEEPMPDSWIPASTTQATMPTAGPVTIDSEAATLRIAQSYLEIGDSQLAAEQLITFAGDTRRSESELRRAASLALNYDEPALAVQLAGVGLQRYPQSAVLYRIHGAAQYRLRDYSAAQSSLLQALSLDNSHPLAYFLLGLTCESLDDSTAAAGYFHQAAALDPRYVRQ